MKVVLLQDVKKVGQKGSVITVADGYAQNVLIPKRLAVPATADAVKRAEAVMAERGEKSAMEEGLARTILAKLDGATVRVTARANEQGTLFEALHAADIVAAIEREHGITIPESAIHLDDPIKKTGSHPVSLSLHDARAVITVTI